MWLAQDRLDTLDDDYERPEVVASVTQIQAVWQSLWLVVCSAVYTFCLHADESAGHFAIRERCFCKGFTDMRDGRNALEAP